jgi:hypothetical protein
MPVEKAVSLMRQRRATRTTIPIAREACGPFCKFAEWSGNGSGAVISGKPASQVHAARVPGLLDGHR